MTLHIDGLDKPLQGPPRPSCGFGTTFPEIEAIAIKHGISLNGFLPNEWEQDGRSKTPWSEDHAFQVDLCREYIKAALVKDIPRRTWSRRDSYGFKHAVERENRPHYIANGSFIVAAFLEGLRVRPNGINAFFMRASSSPPAEVR